ncbi:hypothetical protein QTP88_009513 [Uroleucon formosanum]
MDLDEAKSCVKCYRYGTSSLTKIYFSMPNIMLMTPEIANRASVATTVLTELKTPTELNLVIPVTCVDLRFCAVLCVVPCYCCCAVENVAK